MHFNASEPKRASGALVFATISTRIAIVFYLLARCNKLFTARLIKHKRVERRHTTIP